MSVYYLFLKEINVFLSSRSESYYEVYLCFLQLLKEYFQ